MNKKSILLAVQVSLLITVVFDVGLSHSRPLPQAVQSYGHSECGIGSCPWDIHEVREFLKVKQELKDHPPLSPDDPCNPKNKGLARRSKVIVTCGANGGSHL